MAKTKLKTFSTTITWHRKNQGLSMPKLAAKAKIPKSLLYQIESNPAWNPSVGTLAKIAKALGLRINDLFV